MVIWIFPIYIAFKKYPLRIVPVMLFMFISKYFIIKIKTYIFVYR